MPRQFDFGAKPTREQYREYGLFLPLAGERCGTGEASAQERGIDEWDDSQVPSAQFEYKPGDGIPYYDNASLDPVFEWLEANTSGSWYWHEDCVNNYRSLVVTVWLDKVEDIDAFRERWGDRFAVQDWAMERNARLAQGASASPSP